MYWKITLLSDLTPHTINEIYAMINNFNNIETNQYKLIYCTVRFPCLFLDLVHTKNMKKIYGKNVCI